MEQGDSQDRGPLVQEEAKELPDIQRNHSGKSDQFVESKELVPCSYDQIQIPLFDIPAQPLPQFDTNPI